MDKTKLNELLDSIYELEGLVHLALTRDDSPERLPSLIKIKGEELQKLASRIVAADGESSVEVEEEEKPLYTVDYDGPEDEIETAVEDEGPSMEEDIPQTEGMDTPIEKDMQSVVESVFDHLPVDDTAEREPRGRLVFSINDRYRFKRELFNNSDVDFNNTLAIVASMEDYDEAEDYFLGELQWDAKKGEVSDFLDIIKRYFKE